jgi:hypothetical protein
MIQAPQKKSGDELLVPEVLQSEYESIRSEICEAYKQPERWGAILAALTVAIFALSQASMINFTKREYILYCSAFPMFILIAVIYSSSLTIRKLFKARVDIAHEIKRSKSITPLSPKEVELLNACYSIYINNLKFLGWLVLLYILATPIFMYKATH